LSTMLNSCVEPCNDPDFVDFIDVSYETNIWRFIICLEMHRMEDWHPAHSRSSLFTSFYIKGSQRIKVLAPAGNRWKARSRGSWTWRWKPPKK
jgi:hypothetical protein